jgi:hypothetical protein
MRKKVRGIGVRAAANVVDRRLRDADHTKLHTNECGKVAVRLPSVRAVDGRCASNSLELFGNLFPDLEGAHTNVRPNRDEEFCRRMAERSKRVRNDTRNRPSPTGVHCRHVAALRVCDQHRHAVCRTRRHGQPLIASDERVALLVRDPLAVARRGHCANFYTVNLTQLEETIVRHPEIACEAFSILRNRIVAIAEVKAEIERVERRVAHAAVSRREGVPKPMLV